MNNITWTWDKFLVGVSWGTMPNPDFNLVRVIGIHIGFITIMISPKWGKNYV